MTDLATAPADETDAEAKPKTRTSYLIFQPSDTDSEAWVQVEQGITAISAEAAVREYVKRVGGPEEGASYVAVAERSWKPITVSVRRSERLVFE